MVRPEKIVKFANRLNLEMRWRKTVLTVVVISVDQYHVRILLDHAAVKIMLSGLIVINVLLVFGILIVA